MFAGLNILLGITGSIAAYKSLQLVRALKASGATVQVVLTQSARHFVPPLTLKVFSGQKVFTDLFDPEDEMAHLRLAEEADLILIAPITAHFIAKMTCGLSDDLLSTLLLATQAPVFIAPAMDLGMWEHPAVQTNVALLKERKVRVIGPVSGALASGKTGLGRLASEEEILSTLKQSLSGRSLQTEKKLRNLNILITAGPTQEDIDPVRFISNRSSGKMGYALAEVAAQWGAQVTLISGPSLLKSPSGVKIIALRSAEEMRLAVNKHLPEADIVIMAAAVSDYRPQQTHPQKIKKQQHCEPLALERTRDILAERNCSRPEQVVVGFAAETENLIEHASEKLRRKKLDLIVANDVSQEGAGFDVDTNIAHLIKPDGNIAYYDKMSKRDLAGYILREALEIRRNKEAAHNIPIRSTSHSIS